MEKPSHPPNASGFVTREQFLANNAALVSGEPLFRALGYVSGEAFRRAVLSHEVPVNVFKIKGRRPWYAYSIDVANWLESVGDSPTIAPEPSSESTNPREAAMS